MPKYAARTDANHCEIKRALEKAGCTVLDLSRVGHGVPDLLVRSSKICFLEIKSSDKAKLTPAEYKFALQWQGAVHVVTTVDEALRACGLLKVA